MVSLPRFRMTSKRLRAVPRLGLPACGLLLASALTAQHLTQPKPGETLPSFEVAAIKPDDSGPYHSSINDDNDSYRVENVSLRDLIMNAWDARTKAQIEGGPDKVMGQRFDINARIAQEDLAQLKKLDPKESERQRSLMLQQLLIDRFHLKVHVESREAPVFALVLAKGGPKFKPAAPPPVAGAEDVAASPDKPKPHGQGTWMRMSGTTGELQAWGSSMESLADMLSGQSETSGRYVIDKTGLQGNYDYSLRWTPENLTVNVRSSDSVGKLALDAGNSGPSLFSALESQLGLRLESEKAPVESLVVDHVEAPSPN